MAETNAVSIKLPPFWTAQPHVWFQQVEAEFTMHSITVDSTKYAYTVAALDQETASCLLDLLSHPPIEDKYEAIKSRLLKTFGLTCRVRVNKFLHMDDLGDRLLTALMDTMLALLEGHQPCLLFEQLFLNRIPDSIRLQLAEADFSNPCKVAEHADTLWLSMDYFTVHKTTLSIFQAKGKTQKKKKAILPIPTGASTTTRLMTRQGSVYHGASFRKTPRAAVSSDDGRPEPAPPPLCPRSNVWTLFPSGHRSRSQRTTCSMCRKALLQFGNQANCCQRQLYLHFW